MSIYLDNGATSFPKPRSVEEAIIKALTLYKGSASRSNSSEAHLLERIVYDTRVTIARFFNFDFPDHVIFTKNVTESINLFINGYLQQGDKVIISALEHNAVVRPLEVLKQKKGINVVIIPCDLNGQMDITLFEEAIQSPTKLVILNHVSNVSGDIQSIKAVSDLTHKLNITLMVDAAQSAGVLEVDMKMEGIDVLAFTGHKSLLGPQGIGGLLMSPKLAKEVSPLIYGGTGSLSEHFEQPDIMPDKFESGTPNSLGILGLKAGLDHLLSLEPQEVHRHETKLIGMLQEALQESSHIKVIGNPNPAMRVGILSIDLPEYDNAVIAYRLNKEFGIITRVGLHCSPLAHQTYGTFPKGTIRFSTSIFTTEEDIQKTVIAMNAVIQR